MIKPKYSLIAGGVISALISILHIILAIKPELYSYIGPGQGSAMTQIAGEGSSLITIATITLALIFAIWALYAFSGAGLIRTLPLQRMALIAIGGIYILRGLFLPTEINMVLTQGYPFRFMVFSTVSLVAGLLYLIGVLRKKASVALSK
ncbi:MAG: hypothetical protein A2Y88_01545 [Chloroflexi bacterium RBG_13_48_10]|nr:MAG: hypothetical protein A2Y88_01545 [Chloroflexi bacterium RBG_13_48_10]